jgi:hypothetical protein
MLASSRKGSTMSGKANRLKRITRIKRVALALAVAGVFAPSAYAHYPSEMLATGSSSEGLVIRGDYKAGIGEVATVPVRGESKADIRGVHAASLVRGEDKTDLVRPTPVATASPDSVRFEWRDVGIGAAGLFALALLGASAMIALRRRERRGLATA